jgi:amidase
MLLAVSDEIAFAGVARQAELVREGEASPTELVQLSLERIERLDPELNAFRVVLGERALAEAKAAESGLKGRGKRAKAAAERPLLGVPIALKDSVDLAGERTMNGTDAYDEPAAADSEMTRRLRAAGAIVVGKTHLPELAIFPFTESATWGVSRNPWNRLRTTGGSSGGSAAAVAAGMVPAASASDGGGSIRIPAASCGVFGLKPTRGRIPLDPDYEHWHGLSVNGFETRTVLDTALLLDVTAGGSREPGAPALPERPFAEHAAEQPGSLRIAHSAKPVDGIVAPILAEEVVEAVADTAELLAGLGHRVEPRDPDYGLMPGFFVRYLRGVHDEGVAVPHPERLERRTRGFMRMGSVYPDAVLRRARAAEAGDRRRVLALFDDFDVLVTPVMGGTALPVRRWEGRGALWTLNGIARFYPFTAVWNHLGCPAASVPAGFAADGMPLAVQLVAPRGEEGRILSLAAQLEAERPWADARPPVS